MTVSSTAGDAHRTKPSGPATQAPHQPTLAGGHAPSGIAQAATPALVLAALGVVYGDIGTSPLYALKESFNPAHGVVLDRPSILGILSMLVWALTFVVTFKYIVLILRANHEGEGGVLALQALARRALGMPSSAVSPQATPRGLDRGLLWVVAALGLLGATMFYGDALLTPAISVLSAIEGLEVATPAFKPYVVPITVGILLGLFAVQRWGTGAVGRAFGPVCFVWFATLGGLGLLHIAQTPDVLNALNPMWAAQYAMQHPGMSLVVLGSVFLAVTGAEALYADMGHFGASAVRRAWILITMPGLLLNYFGQGALLMRDPSALENPLFRMVPQAWVIPLVILAAAATVIASQATISGAFSLTQQAMAMGYLPRMKVVQTESTARGQIYIPAINGLMLAGVLVLVLSFGSSSGLAAAYGISISVTMLCTTVLFGMVAWRLWKWQPVAVAVLVAAMLAIDLVFVVSNGMKILHGGWVPVVLAAVLMVLMATWSNAVRQRNRKQLNQSLELKPFVEQLMQNPPHRVLGTAVFLTAKADEVPHSLLHNLKHNQVLHERVLIFSISTADGPWVDPANMLHIEELASNVWAVHAQFGFMQQTNVHEAVQLFGYRLGIDVSSSMLTYFTSRSSLGLEPPKGLAKLTRWLLVWLQRNASRAADFYRLPENRVVEFGRRQA